MMQYKFYGYDTDIIKQTITDFHSGNQIFIYPARKAQLVAQKYYQSIWDFSETTFITMEELKEMLFCSGLPVLKEDKRAIALYNSLTPDIKEKLNVDNYFSFVRFAGNFFSFWEEFNDELIPSGKSLTGLLPHEETLEWQEDLFATMQNIRREYKSYLSRKGWTDKIFLQNEANLNLEQMFLTLHNSITTSSTVTFHFVFVNQFYYTNLENHIIRQLSTLKTSNFASKVTVCYQLPEDCINKTNNTFLTSSDIYKHSGKILTNKIRLSVTGNDFSTLKELIETVDAHNSEITIIERGFSFSPYSRYLSPETFKGRDSEFFPNSTIYNFFKQIEAIFANLVEADRKGERVMLLPLVTVMELMSDPVFFNYFSTNDDNRENLLTYLDKLLRNDDYYIDIFDSANHNISFGEDSTDIFGNLALLIKRLMRINTPDDFIDMIDSKEGLRIDKILSGKEKSGDITAQFYNSLANFSALSEINIFEEDTFSGWKYPVRWIIKLFLETLKPKRFRYPLKKTGKQVEISSLLDSRNISFDSIALLNLSEGVLPSSRITPFLLTESQRKALRLKTYDDIRHRERYYFLRLIFNTRDVRLFARKSEDDNIEVSSFVEELLIREPQLFETPTDVTYPLGCCNGCFSFRKFFSSQDTQYGDLYETIFNKPYTLTQLPLNGKSLPPSFFTIPIDPAVDLKDNSLAISYTSYRDMSDSPFAFYLKHIARIDEERRDNPLSAKLIGTIAHEIFQLFWEQTVRHEQETGHRSISTAKLRTLCDEVINSNKFFLKIPRTYNTEFFKRIVLPVIQEGIGSFLAINDELVSNSRNKILPEDKVGTVPLPVFDSLPFSLLIKGRTDLTIIEPRTKNQEPINQSTENQEPKTKHIFDYKTGKVSDNKYADQLVIYELLSYLSDPELVSEDTGDVDSILQGLQEHLNSYLFSLVEGEQKKLTDFYVNKSKEEMVKAFLEKLTGTLTLIKDIGFTVSRAKSGNKIHKDVIRTDLLRLEELPVISGN